MSGGSSIIPSNDPNWLDDGTRLEEHIQSWWSDERRCAIPPPTDSFLVNLGFDPSKIQHAFAALNFVSSSSSGLDEWWSKQRRDSKVPPSPFEFLVARGWDSNKVRAFLVESIKDISSGKRSLAPGNLAIVAKHCSDVLRDVSAKNGYSILLDLFDRGTENDIMTMVEILPDRCLNSGTGTGRACFEDMWEECLRGTFSTDLVEFMMRRFNREQLYLPTGTGSAGVGVDYLYMKAISPAVQTVTTLSIDCGRWREDGLIEFFRVILSNKSLRTLNFLLTDNIDSNNDGGTSTGKVDLQALMGSVSRLAENSRHTCGVKALGLSLGRESPLLGVLQVLVDANPGMEKLALFNRTDERASSVVAHAMKLRKLKRVELHTGTSSLAQCNTSPIFKALEHDTSVSYLYFNGRPNDPVGEAKFLLDVLQQNTTLKEVSSWSSNWKLQMTPAHPQPLNEIEKNIEFFLALNRCGRGKLRDPDTSLREFVTLLYSVRRDGASRSPLGFLRRSDVLSVQYGLLRESPSKWCHRPGPSVEARQDRKRKFSGV